FLYSYGMGSHSVHQDGDAILIMDERERRDSRRQRAIELAHGAREISDLMTFAMLRAFAAYIAHKIVPKPVQLVTDRCRELTDELHAAIETWHTVEYSTPST